MTDAATRERMEKIANRCLDLLEERLSNLKAENQFTATTEVKELYFPSFS